MHPVEILRCIKQAIRHPYAWPGGYPLHVVMRDGEVIALQTARENWQSICWATLSCDGSGWAAIGVEVNWDDEAMMCSHTGEPIPCAYPA